MRTTENTIAQKNMAQASNQLILQAILHNLLPAEGVLEKLNLRYTNEMLIADTINNLQQQSKELNACTISEEYEKQLVNRHYCNEEIKTKLGAFVEEYLKHQPTESALKEALSFYALEISLMAIDEDNLETSEVDANFSAISPSSPLSDFAIELAKCKKMPVNTCFFTTTVMFSALASRYANVSYRDGKTLPLTEYFCGEYPSSGGKSAVLNATKAPIEALTQKDEKKLLNEFIPLKEKSEVCEDKQEKANIKMKIAKLEKQKNLLVRTYTDATPEALDSQLKLTNGFFCVASSEQASINSLLGLSYSKDGKANLDCVLNGFDAGVQNALRLGRDAFSGKACGTMCILAQQGTIESILKASGSTGLAQRFLFFKDPSNIGSRNHLEHHVMNSDIVDAYAEMIRKIYIRVDFNREYDELETLNLSPEAWTKIDEFRQGYESSLADGQENSSDLLRGIIGKIDMHIMKISSLLHLSIDPSCTLIHDDRVDEAILIAQGYIAHIKSLVRDSIIKALSEQDEAILNLLHKKSLTGKEISDKLYRKICFRINGKMSRKTVQSAIETLLKRDWISVVKNSKSFNETIYAKN